MACSSATATCSTIIMNGNGTTTTTTTTTTTNTSNNQKGGITLDIKTAFSAKKKLEEYFYQWIYYESTEEMIRKAIEATKIKSSGSRGNQENQENQKNKEEIEKEKEKGIDKSKEIGRTKENKTSGASETKETKTETETGELGRERETDSNQKTTNENDNNRKSNVGKIQTINTVNAKPTATPTVIIKSPVLSPSSAASMIKSPLSSFFLKNTLFSLLDNTSSIEMEMNKNDNRIETGEIEGINELSSMPTVQSSMESNSGLNSNVQNLNENLPSLISLKLPSTISTTTAATAPEMNTSTAVTTNTTAITSIVSNNDDVISKSPSKNSDTCFSTLIRDQNLNQKLDKITIPGVSERPEKPLDIKSITPISDKSNIDFMPTPPLPASIIPLQTEKKSIDHFKGEIPPLKFFLKGKHTEKLYYCQREIEITFTQSRNSILSLDDFKTLVTNAFELPSFCHRLVYLSISNYQEDLDRNATPFIDSKTQLNEYKYSFSTIRRSSTPPPPDFFNSYSPIDSRLDNAIHSIDLTNISKDILLSYFKHELLTRDPMERIMFVLKTDKLTRNKTVSRTEIYLLVKEIIELHPSLDFLKDSKEFQDKYALTVVTRIFYVLDAQNHGYITLKQFKKCNFYSLLQSVDGVDDINKINSYFSYEHFYVLYCTFLELDSDHDSFITYHDLMQYNNRCLTQRIVERIIRVGRKASARALEINNDVLSYEDFIYFMLSEEDKTNVTSLSYWFQLVDLNEDGKIDICEMRYFYDMQLERMECLGNESIAFEDILCQITDIINPKDEGYFVLEDFIKPSAIQFSGLFFDILCNLDKFLLFETRDPFQNKDNQSEIALSEWDKFALSEYARLAFEEETRNDENLVLLNQWNISDDVDGNNYYIEETDANMF